MRQEGLRLRRRDCRRGTILHGTAETNRHFGARRVIDGDVQSCAGRPLAGEFDFGMLPDVDKLTELDADLIWKRQVWLRGSQRIKRPEQQMNTVNDWRASLRTPRQECVDVHGIMVTGNGSK